MNEQAIADADQAELPALTGELARLHALALSRLVTPTLVPTRSEPEADALLTATEAAKLANVSPNAMLRNAHWASARRYLGRRTVRFDRAAILRAIRRAA